MLSDRSIQDRLDVLVESGVTILDPRQTFVAADVDLDRIEPGVILFPGACVYGSRTFIAEHSQIGTEGPTTLRDAVIGPNSVIGSGYIHESVLIGRARMAGNVHIRRGCLLEEEVSIGHSVGLKQTLLLSFVTLGSVINFCDVLMGGGRSRHDHSEVGSGFIHFNFTPRGARGDKATASLVGDVVDGVFLDQPRIFLGGAGGAIGPLSVGFGSVSAAGQVLRRDIERERLVLRSPAERDQPLDQRLVARRILDIWNRNAGYMSQLCALRAWYVGVRRPRAEAQRSARTVILLEAAIHTIDYCIAERLNHLRSFFEQHVEGQHIPDEVTATLSRWAECPIDPTADAVRDHITWVRELDDESKTRLRDWLRLVAAVAHASICPPQTGL